MLWLVQGCAASVALSPPADDLKAVTEAKPVPSDDIATSDQANADFSAAIEAWGDRISAAGGRLCRWNERVYKVNLACPKE